MEGVGPINARPYHYPYFQKEDIEILVKEMLNRPYSSLVLLVREADGNWRMCVDYKVLNQITIKYNYPILHID